MANKENTLIKGLKNRLYDGVDLAGNIGFVGVIDFLWGFSIDSPMEDIAIGAGLQAGEAMSKDTTSRLVSSITATGVSMYPDFAHLFASGDAEIFLKGAGVKAVCYGVGIITHAVLTGCVKGQYNGMIEVNATFECETQAKQACEYIKGLVNVGEYIRRPDSIVDDLQKTRGVYSLHARIIGKTSEMQKFLKPALTKYFSKTTVPLEAKVSDVVNIK
ncbi:hypothetical protein HY486_02205 [Candidatus Woesearchaeota archaeon]|nr:hypothetical protein [Candidatus Woesearchaeota archaeon]